MKLFFRYIDDTYFKEAGYEGNLKQFISKINEVCPSIKLDFNYSKNQKNFLDTAIKNSPLGKLLTTQSRKQIDRQSYTHRKSEHPEDFLCTTQEDFKEQSAVLSERLIERGYNKNEVQQQISKTNTIVRT